MEAGAITSISQLPSNTQTNIPAQIPPNSSQNQNNIVLQTTEVVNQGTNNLPGVPQPIPQQQQQMNTIESVQNTVQQNPTNYNELVNQIQKASQNGGTGLPSRDIPIDPATVKNDEETKPNFIPPPPSVEDYIQNMQTPENLILQNEAEQAQLNNIELIYQELQIPIIITLLYFLFNLPAVKKQSQKMLPMLFNQDGNPNLYGYLLNSILFGFLFYVIFKLFNKIAN